MPYECRAEACPKNRTPESQTQLYCCVGGFVKRIRGPGRWMPPVEWAFTWIISLGPDDLKGHGFSRAVKVLPCMMALATEGLRFGDEMRVPSGAEAHLPTHTDGTAEAVPLQGLF